MKIRFFNLRYFTHLFSGYINNWLPVYLENGLNQTPFFPAIE